MASVFVYGGVAVAAGAPARRWAPILARISFFYLSKTVILVFFAGINLQTYQTSPLHF